jgi:hypothetical protein
MVNLKVFFKIFCHSEFQEFETLGISNFTASPRTESGIFELRQMPFRIGDYSKTTSSPAKRNFAKLNLLICLSCEMRSLFHRGGKLEDRSI